MTPAWGVAGRGVGRIVGKILLTDRRKVGTQTQRAISIESPADLRGTNSSLQCFS